MANLCEKNTCQNRIVATVILLCFFLINGIIFLPINAFAQGGTNPVQWRFRNGNPEATRYQEARSFFQNFSSLEVKWSTPQVYGAMQPLVGNLLDTTFGLNPRVSLQAIALDPSSLVIIGGDGKTVTKATLSTIFPDRVQSIGVSVLIDGVAFGTEAFSPLIWGLEMMEQQHNDSSAFTYLMGYNKTSSQVEVLKRLKINMKRYGANSYASITPVFGKQGANGGPVVYATVDITSPEAGGSPNPVDRSYNSNSVGFPDLTSFPVPYFRGLATFETDAMNFPFPQPDNFDDSLSRIMMPYPVDYSSGFATPSVTDDFRGARVALPTFYGGQVALASNSAIRSFPGTFFSRDSIYLPQFNLTSPVTPSNGLVNLSAFFRREGAPQFRPFYVGAINAFSPSSRYVLLAEEFGVLRSSGGRAPELHIIQENGAIETLPNIFIDTISNPLDQQASDVLRSFRSPRENHRWSISVGDIDGGNPSLDFYPNNPGREIVASLSTPGLITNNNQLYVLRFNTNPRRTPKTSSTDSLRYLDTICSMRITGWVAAVNDFDGDDRITLPSGAVNPHYLKDEIFIVNNARLLALRLRSYEDIQRQLPPFDTVYSFDFGTEPIASVAIVDMDGDGRNDILVTTQQRTYLLGVRQFGQLEILNPALTSSGVDLCLGDVFPLRWINRTAGPESVNIFFQPSDSAGNARGTRRLLAGRYMNSTDTVEYTFQASNATLGTGTGYFVVEGFQQPEVQARSAVVRVTEATLVVATPTTGTIVTVGTFLPVSGTARCIDDIYVFYRNPALGTEWSPLVFDTIPNPDGTFSFTLPIACDRSFFQDCIVPTRDTLIEFMLIGRRVAALTFSDTVMLSVRPVPATFPITVDRPEVLCPTRTFTWDPATIMAMPDFPFYSPCDGLNVRISLDSGKTFYDISAGGTPALGDLMYPTNPAFPDQGLIRTGSFLPIDVIAGGVLVWKVPPVLPDSVIFRFCCQATGCIYAEIGVPNPQPSFVKIVAPNPFRGDAQPVEVLYTVSEFINVTISVYDQSNRLVARPVEGQLRAPNTTYCDRWDGTRQDGTPASNGMYYLVVEQDNGKREVYNIFLARDY